LKYDILLSPLIPEIGAIGDHAARMSTPGAAISGYTIRDNLYIRK